MKALKCIFFLRTVVSVNESCSYSSSLEVQGKKWKTVSEILVRCLNNLSCLGQGFIKTLFIQDTFVMFFDLKLVELRHSFFPPFLRRSHSTDSYTSAAALHWRGEHLKSVFLFPQPVSVLNISSLLLAAVLCFISCWDCCYRTGLKFVPPVGSVTAVTARWVSCPRLMSGRAVSLIALLILFIWHLLGMFFSLVLQEISDIGNILWVSFCFDPPRFSLLCCPPNAHKTKMFGGTAVSSVLCGSTIALVVVLLLPSFGIVNTVWKRNWISSFFLEKKKKGR